MSKKTTRLTKIQTTRLTKMPWDPYAPGEYYDQRFRGTSLEFLTSSKQERLPWYFRAWHWHIKQYVEAFYPRSIYYMGKRFYQRLVYGYDYTDFWNLDYTIANFILPRLKEFRRRAEVPNIMSGFPVEMDPCWGTDFYNETGCTCEADEGHQRWLADIDEMIYAFESIVLDENSPGFNRMFQVDEARLKQGLAYFAQYLEGLWE